jgi:hypothetical protein
MQEQTEGDFIAGSAISEEQALELGVEAYIYGYPLVLMDVTRSVLTNAARPSETTAPLNRFGNMRAFPDDTMTKVVSPNADTLYSFAWLDLAKEPIILSVPDTGARYYLMQMLDAWTNVFASLGSRTTGNSKGNFAIVGPQWSGKLPPGVQEVESPTNTVWIIGRTQTNGKEDYPAVHAIQDQYHLTPLSARGATYKPPENKVRADVDMEKPPVEQVADMDAAMFFTRLNALLKDNPPAQDDADAVKRWASLGIGPGQTFDLGRLNPGAAEGLEACVDAAQTRIISDAKKPHGKVYSGWEFMDDIGRYGTDYLWRAVVALVGLGANLPQDALYPRATKDAKGQPLSGRNQYEITFLKGQLPPVGAFWSITLYNSKQFFAKNPINRYALGDRDKLKFNSDGSLTIYLQTASPGKDRESNWLPAPKDDFSLFMRLYWPHKEILQGTWRPPGIERMMSASRSDRAA